ncbi:MULTISPECIES: TniQ family protein [Bacillus cereus group]|uniref:TniQ family protein n=1 Tax=Bacillus cereus group TaxID=86661 RepID=UPI0001A1C695|nr:TniQ family protein [Bacillus thuringiensis]EEM69038.1 Zinc finger protein [Bacillus thuringiensis serovar andalousiensis BGSC 4AW1]OUA98284.1 hypothetical protein BK714_13040 [Bacillus thuringiensis serovar oswaldocruzi]
MSLQRSSLYSVVPIGIGTVEAESLCSYISRLADIHCVTVGDIMKYLIAPKINKEYINNIGISGGNGFYKSSSLINGHGIIAKDFIEVIAFLTCREDVERTTFNNCQKLISFRGLLKNIRYWCPSCFQIDLETTGVIYERLSWNLQSIHNCLIHERVLESICPFCNSHMYTLERKSLPGYCSKCLCWLGNRDNIDISIENQMINKFKKKFFLELTNMSIENNSVAQSLLFYIENNFEGSLKKAADFFGYPKSTFWGWKEGENLISLHALIDITMKLNLGLISFLKMREKKESLFCNYNSRPNIFKRVGKDHYKIQDSLNFIVGKKIPYSLSKVARLLECDRKLLTKMYPNECREIRINYLKNIEMKKQNKDKVLKEEIDNAIYILKKGGIYPSRRKIEKMIGEGKLREKMFQDYWKNNKIIKLEKIGEGQP